MKKDQLEALECPFCEAIRHFLIMRRMEQRILGEHLKETVICCETCHKHFALSLDDDGEMLEEVDVELGQ